MFCQACGAKNSEDARFCNKCGARIASPGQPGGLLSGPEAPKPADAAASVPAASAPVASAPVASPSGQAAAGRGATMVLGSKQAAVQAGAQGPASAAASVSASSSPASGEDVWAVHDGRAPTGGAMHPQGYLPVGDNPTITNVTLASLGIRSPTKAWGFLLALAFVLVSVGAVAMWFWLGAERSVIGDSGESTDSGDGPSDSDGADVEIGTPLPTGLDAPDRDFVAGTPRVARRSGTTMRTAAQSASRMTTSARRPSTMASTAMSGGTTTASTSMESTGGSRAAEPPTSMGPPPTSTDVPEERDIETDLYTGRVRYVISRYYASRAQGCFDRATRNQRTVRGRVVIAFTIGTSGAVSRSSVGQNSTGINSLGECLANQVRTWRLPAPPGGQPLSLEMPFSR